MVFEASTMCSLSPFSSTLTLSRGTTATTEKAAPSGFQHWVQPQAWLWATSPLTPTLTGLSLHLQTRVPPAKLPEPFLTPWSTDGWIAVMGLSSLCLTFLNQNAVSIQNTTTERIDLPSCIRSNPLLISSSSRTWVIIGSISILPLMYQSTIFGTSLRPRTPPNAVPFQARPVLTSSNGWAAISLPGSAAPIATS